MWRASGGRRALTAAGGRRALLCDGELRVASPTEFLLGADWRRSRSEGAVQGPDL